MCATVGHRMVCSTATIIAVMLHTPYLEGLVGDAQAALQLSALSQNPSRCIEMLLCIPHANALLLQLRSCESVKGGLSEAAA